MAESELVEKDPQLDAIVDKNSNRNLLDTSNPSPLVIDLTAGKPQRFMLKVENSPAGLIDLSIAADQAWLQPENGRLTLVGGESGECTISAKPEGDGDFATLMFSWEGTEQTLVSNVLVQRSLGDHPPPSSDGGRPAKPAIDHGAAIKKLEKYIDGCGGNDKFIDYDEEQKIFRNGGKLELTLTVIEALLHKKCSEGGWTRQTRLTDKLTAMLEEATKDDGVIDSQEYEHIVNFAVKRKMPRRDADEHCVTLILDNAWKAKEGLMNKWFTKKRKQYGF